MIAILVILMIISSVSNMPLQLPLFQPLIQQQSMLQQLRDLQQLQKISSLQYHNQKFARPLLILLPKPMNLETNEETKYKQKINLKQNDLNPNKGFVDEDADSIVIDAETKPNEETQKAILLIPNEGRFFIGDFISSIPFLPIEINVPDSISWIYDGISSIISGIGQRLPFRPQMLDTTQSSEQIEANLRIMPGRTKKITPILLIPIEQQLPFQI